MLLSMLSLLLAVLWLGNVMVRPLHSQSRGGKYDFLVIPTSGNDSGQLVRTCASVTNQYNLYRSNGSDAVWLGM